MLWLHALFVGLLVGTELFFSGLSILNLRHGERTARTESDWIEESLDIDDVEKLLDYHRIKTGKSLLQSWIGLGALVLVLYSGLFAEAVTVVESLGLGAVGNGVVFLLGLVVASTILSLPFDAFGTFGIEEVFDFNQQSPRLWVRDKVVGTVIAVALTGLVGAAVLWVLDTFPTWWWVGAWALFVAFSLLMMVVYPRVIAPLFNDFDPIEEGELREAVDDTFEKAGFDCEQVYEMDASKRSSKSNAYFVGFGRTKRVVLFDTLVEDMSIPAVQGVLAHELAHWKRAHIWKQIAASALEIGIVLAALGWLVDQPAVYELFGVSSGAAYAHLILAFLWIRPINRFTSPLSNRLSLAHEREADSFAVEVMGSGQPMVDALTTLASENLANPFPHPWYATFHYDHPPIPERIRYIRDQSDGSVESGPETPGNPDRGDPA